MCVVLCVWCVRARARACSRGRCALWLPAVGRVRIAAPSPLSDCHNPHSHFYWPSFVTTNVPSA